MRIRLLIYSLAMTAGLASTPGRAQQPPNANVQEVLMGPRTQQIIMSTDGDHLAIQSPKGSRQVVFIDGVEGPVFDDIVASAAVGGDRVQFSLRGGHGAYVGRRGDDYIAVVDGKETGTMYSTQTSRLAGGGSPQFWFSDDGSSIAYAVINPTGSWSMVVNGLKGPTYPAFDLKKTLFRGKRFAYVAQTNDRKWYLVVDGKQGPGYDVIDSLQMTADGAHYAFIGTTGGSTMVVVDGVAKAPYTGISGLEMAPDGRVAYQAAKPATPNRAITGVIVVDGQEIESVRGFVVTVGPGLTVNRNVAFSPDGKRFAYLRQTASGVVVVVDGKPGLEYRSVGELQFSPDGRRFFYIANSTSGTFPVIDGQELQAFDIVMDFRFSPDGKRYMFKGAAQGSGVSVWVDGKPEAKIQGDVYSNSLTFSPDGRHYAYGVQGALSAFPVVDGQPKPGRLAMFQTRMRANPAFAFPILYFSPDSSRFAYTAIPTSGVQKPSMFVDGAVYEGSTPLFSYPSFSPNSKHLGWLNWTSRSWTPFVDGKAGPGYEDILETNVNACRFVDDHTFRFYGIKDNQIYRVIVNVVN